MNILVTGGAGYIGSKVVRNLLDQNHKVTVIDKMIFGDVGIKDLVNRISYLEVIDIRDLNPSHASLFETQDAVIHLAAIANDPMGKLHPEVTDQVNVYGTSNVFTLAKMCGVKKFIYASSASVYGFNEDVVTEESPLNPQSLYAQSKIDAENELHRLNSDNKTELLILRQGTVSGLSLRMRYDLIINAMVRTVMRHQRVVIYGDDNTSRPIVSIDDLVNIYDKFLAGEIPSGTYNTTGFNAKVLEVATEISKMFNVPAFYGLTNTDSRSYKMNCDKLNKVLGDYKFQTMAEIANSVKNGFESHPDNATTQSIDWIKGLEYVYPYSKYWRSVL